MTPSRQSISRWTLVPLGALTLIVLVLIPQRAGPVAAFAAVAPLACGAVVLLLLPLAVVRRDAILALPVTAVGIVAVLAYAARAAPSFVTADDPFGILTWNLHGEPVADVGLATALTRSDLDVIVLQEAGVDALSLVPADMETVHHPEAATTPGMLLATRLPILDSGTLDQPAGIWDRPRAFWLTLDTGGAPLTVVGVHLNVPFPLSSLPCPYCPTLRDGQVQALASFAAEREAAGESVLIAGDFNLSEREVAYRDLAALTDTGSAGTWRPLPISWLPPVLRLDYVMVGDGIGIVSSSVDCAISSSDHCPLTVHLAIP